MKKLCILLAIFSALSLAQSNDDDQINISSIPDSQENLLSKHSIDLRVSFWNNSQSAVSVGFHGFSVETGTGGISGEIMYNYYPNSVYSFYVSAGVMNTEVRVENLSTYTSTVIPIMMGMKYYIIDYYTDNPFRPYVSGSIGGLFGTESAVEILNVRTHTETAVGGSAGFGTDIILGSLVKLQAEISYNLFTDFAEEIGGNKNYSGPEFSLGIGFMF
ncbi:MAG: hypothetical protein WBH40_12280 [Ignavibacteriaceae bacterium]